MNKTYSCDPAALNSLEQLAKREVVQIVLGSIAGFLLVFFCKEIKWMWIIVVLCIVFVIASIALRATFKNKVAQYSSSKVTLTDKGVEGVCFDSENDLDGRPFSVKYEEILSASGFAGEKINLTIRTNGAEYKCLAIENASEAASMIMHRKKKLAESKDEAKPERSEQARAAANEPSPARPAVKTGGPVPGIIFCPKCGAKAPADSNWCPKCGESVR